jgi:hypothetical protein
MPKRMKRVTVWICSRCGHEWQSVAGEAAALCRVQVAVLGQAEEDETYAEAARLKVLHAAPVLHGANHGT